MFYLLFFECYLHPPDLPSFPTRRSSDLALHLVGLERSLSGSSYRRATEQSVDTRSRSAHTRASAYTWRGCRRDRGFSARSEEHTSELQSLRHLVCRLLLEKKK